jgi:hypothetical protein
MLGSIAYGYIYKQIRSNKYKATDVEELQGSSKRGLAIAREA